MMALMIECMKAKPFRWTLEAELSFLKIKERLCSQFGDLLHILVTEFILYTDHVACYYLFIAIHFELHVLIEQLYQPPPPFPKQSCHSILQPYANEVHISHFVYKMFQYLTMTYFKVV